MTLEEVIAELKAVKADTASRIAEVETKAAEERDKLKGKIGELIAEKKKLKAKTRPPADDDEDADEDEAGEDDAPRGAKKQSPDLARVQREHERALTEMRDTLDKARKKAEDAAIRTALADALDKAGIAPEYRAAVEALLKGKHKVEVADDDTVLFDGKSVSDSVAGWVKNEGRAFIKAPASGGSAATSGAPSGGANQQKPRSQMSPAEKGKFLREHGQDAYNQLPR